MTAIGRPHQMFPTVGKRFRQGRWRLFWRKSAKIFEFSLGAIPEATDAVTAEAMAEHRRVELMLALRTNDWPDWALAQPVVRRYIGASVPTKGADVLLAEYERAIRGTISERWAQSSLAILRELRDFCQCEYAAVTPQQAEAFLAHVLQTPGPRMKGRGKRSKVTRNKIAAVCGKFYKHATRLHGFGINPFRGVRQLTTRTNRAIVHLSREERDTLLTAADADVDGLAVWLGCYLGLRREEVHRLRWEDIHWTRRKVYVMPGKTGRDRWIDLPSKLRTRLEAVKVRQWRIMGWPDAAGEWQYRADKLIDRLADALPPVASKLGYNTFRHTFASLLVQEGVSVFKVAAWLGDDVRTAVRHYAAMMPTHDEDIDRL